MLQSETIIAKIQFEVENSVNALFPEDQEEVKKYLKEKSHNLKEQLKKRREKKLKKFTNRPNYGYYSPKLDPPHQQLLVSGPKEAVAANDQIYTEILVCKDKRKRKVTRRSLKKIYRKERRQAKNACY